LTSINSPKTYQLNETYKDVKGRAFQILQKYLNYPALITFNDLDRSVTFSTERLVPVVSKNRPRILLLFSNPHPYSVQQGMFLSPNTKGRENLFWSSMRDAGWIITEGNHGPAQLADICLNVKYQGPFEMIFYCYYAFPTPYPEDIIKIFGKDYFKKVIEPEARDEFRKTIEGESAEAVVTFNKEIFNLVSKDRIERYIESLKESEIIQSQIDGVDRSVPIFLTYPTGWRYHREHRQFRKASLDTIRTAIIHALNAPDRKTAD
jgi:hypothetical protein